MWGIWRRSGARSAAIALSVAVTALGAASGASAAQTVSFATAPSLPNLTGVTLSGQPQTTPTTWDLTTSPFQIKSAGTTTGGWNLTVKGRAGAGRSAVFKQYCPSGPCGSDPTGYVTGGFTLPADSLTWDTTGDSFTGATGTKPGFECSSGCHIDSASAVNVVSTAVGATNTTWTTSGSSTLSLATPASLRKLQTGEVYRLDVVWTVSTGP
jgi:hypothetical protein